LKNYRRYLIIFSAPVVIFLISYLALALYIGNKAEEDTKMKADALLVLGARSYIDGKYNPCLEARVEHAVDLYKANYAHKLIVSGGNDHEDNANEAETMKKIAVEKGVKPNDILMEKTATSTYENFTHSQSILTNNKLKSVIVVTEPFHMARSILIAEKLNYNFTVSQAADSPCWKPQKYMTKYFLKEPIAIMLYKLQNKL
jgi:uncharacterized SAM-binding protein YcdF (DUF218 family)